MSDLVKLKVTTKCLMVEDVKSRRRAKVPLCPEELDPSYKRSGLAESSAVSIHCAYPLEVIT